MLFFDYLYYRTYLFYLKRKDSVPGPSTLSVVVVMQLANLTSIIFIASVIYGRLLFINKSVAVFLFIFTLIINGIYYKKNNFDKLADKWRNEESGLKNKRGIGIVIYIILSLVLFFGLAIYLGSMTKTVAK